MIKKYDNKPGWVELRYRVGSVRKRETVKASVADTRAAQIERDLVSFRIPLTDREIEEYRAAMHLLPEGMTLVQAVVAAGGIPKLSSSQGSETINLALGIEKYLQHCAVKGLSERTLQDRQQHLFHFVRRGAGTNHSLPQFTWQIISGYLDSFSCSKTSNSRRATLASFFDYWRKISGVADSAPHPVRQVEPRKVVVKDPVPFSPSTLFTLLKTAYARRCSDSLMFLALGAYTGVRAAEVTRLTWADVWDFQENKPKTQLALSSAITKTSRRRVVPLTSAVAAVLTDAANTGLIPLSKPAGPVVGKKLRRKLAATTEEAGVEWVANGLRKGYVSSCVALLGAEQTSAYAGHSISVLESNYKALVSEEEAKAWFQVPEFLNL